MKPARIAELTSILKASLDKNEIVFIQITPERNPNGHAWRLSGVKERGVTVNVLGHDWFFEWDEIAKIC